MASPRVYKGKDCSRVNYDYDKQVFGVNLLVTG